MKSPSLALFIFALVGVLPPETSANDHNGLTGFRGSLTRTHDHTSNYSAAVHRDARRHAVLSCAAGDAPALGVQAPVAFPGFAFGCSTADGASGIAGLGRSPLSQLGVGRFSYCLRSDAAAGVSPILFGSLANVAGGGDVQSTPLVQNPAARRAPYYYVNLTGVTVGATDLPVTAGTFGFTRIGSGGVIVDSGTTFTYLADAGYAMVKQAAGLMKRVSGARFDFDLCFEATAGDAAALPVPSLTLRFAAGAEYAVPRQSYFDAVDEQGRVACLLVLPTGGVSVIGNVMQMDLHVLFDVDGGMFSFAPADCASV